MSLASALPAFRLERGTAIAQADVTSDAPVTIDSPALDVMTDLTRVKAATTHPATTLRQAEQMMIYQGVRMLFVVTAMPTLEGLITSTDLRGERQMSLVHTRHMRFDDMRVADVMTELSMLDAIDYEPMVGATVVNVVATLKRVGRNHLLVVQAAAHGVPRRVRGVISRTQVERQLGQLIDITEIASSFPRSSAPSAERQRGGVRCVTAYRSATARPGRAAAGCDRPTLQPLDVVDQVGVVGIDHRRR
jgi:signal-transduction protein with cAMP-binding, CBS, and nucleotidyltransferase domain